MKTAIEIFEKHWIKATGKPLDDMTKHHMGYAIDAIQEALEMSDHDINRIHKCDYILTTENNKRVIKCQKCNYTQPI